jgi:hypothetical protein
MSRAFDALSGRLDYSRSPERICGRYDEPEVA